MDDFFGDLAEATIGVFKEMAVLESMSSDLTIPRLLTAVPARFCDGDSQPLVMISNDTAHARLYLSNGYQETDLPMLLRLGVCEMSDMSFLESLASGIYKSQEKFRARPCEWHSRLATQLLSLLAKHPGALRTVASLPLIPLHDGRWVAAQDGLAVFESSRNAQIGYCSTDLRFGVFNLPGIKTARVSAAVSNDPSRKLLFTTLGIREEDSGHALCDQLAERHDSPDFDPKTIPAEELVAHVAYMYRCGWTNSSKRKIWLVTAAGEVRRGGEIYVDSGDAHTISSYLRSFHKLHPRYMLIPSDSEPEDKFSKFVSWLVSCCRLSVVPRLVDSPESPSFRLSDDFAFVIQNQPSSRVLQLLRDHWDYYSYWIVPSSAPDGLVTEIKRRNHSRRLVLRELATLSVLCMNGQVFRLEETVLPTAALMARRTLWGFENRLLSVPEPDSAAWDFLSVFGVRIQITMRNLYSPVGRLVERLEALASDPDKSPESIAAAAASIYSNIDLACPTELDEVRTIFRTRKLIYYHVKLASGEARTVWCASTECRWAGDRALWKTPMLMRLPQYANLRDFFTGKLLVATSADVEIVVDEILRISMTDPVSYITGLFLLLQRSLPNGAEELVDLGLTKKLRQRRIFPILRGNGRLGSDFDDLGRMEADCFWLVADRQHLRKSFQGLVPLLSVSETRFPVIRELLRALNLENRCLSRHAERKVMGDGDAVFLEGFSVIMRKKTRFIAR